MTDNTLADELKTRIEEVLAGNVADADGVKAAFLSDGDDDE